jgi:hypothetical protein
LHDRNALCVLTYDKELIEPWLFTILVIHMGSNRLKSHLDPATYPARAEAYPDLTLQPSEYCRRQFYTTFGDDAAGVLTRRLMGGDNRIWRNRLHVFARQEFGYRKPKIFNAADGFGKLI